jgi:hypothetical protein
MTVVIFGEKGKQNMRNLTRRSWLSTFCAALAAGPLAWFGFKAKAAEDDRPTIKELLAEIDGRQSTMVEGPTVIPGQCESVSVVNHPDPDVQKWWCKVVHADGDESWYTVGKHPMAACPRPDWYVERIRIDVK